MVDEGAPTLLLAYVWLFVLRTAKQPAHINLLTTPLCRATCASVMPFNPGYVPPAIGFSVLHLQHQPLCQRFVALRTIATSPAASLYGLNIVICHQCG